MKYLLTLLILLAPLSLKAEPDNSWLSDKKHFYHYRIHVTQVYDGDTVTADIEVGLGITLMNQKLRLYGINTPEVRGPEKPDGLYTRDELRKRILGRTLIMDSHGDSKGKYGRWLATLWVEDDGMWENINEWLVKEKLGKPATY